MVEMDTMKRIDKRPSRFTGCVGKRLEQLLRLCVGGVL